MAIDNSSKTNNATQNTPQQGNKPKASDNKSFNRFKKKPVKKTDTTPKTVGDSKNEAKKPQKAAGNQAKPAVKNQNNNTAKKPNPNQKRNRNYQNRNKAKNAPSLKIIPLGGINEIGKNMTAFECGDDIFIVDCGLAFPDSDMLGVDVVIPDFDYVEKNFDKIKGLVVTHGHEDHIGGIPYLLKSVNVPVYATKLTIGLITHKLKEKGLLNKSKLNILKPRDSVKMGCMSVEFIRVNHSIPDAVALAITTPVGVVIMTGDFKIDYTPIEGEAIDLARFGELGNQGVLALFCDSTNAERPGYTISERKVGQSIKALIDNATGKRIIVASFASNIHRVQQIIDAAVAGNRKVALSGRSMINVVDTAMKLGYLTVPSDCFIDIYDVPRLPDDKVCIITTGSQGEPMAALSRMAAGDHRQVSVSDNDFIIISATPIPGNEKTVTRVVNDLLKLGAEVIYERMFEVHVSGHAFQDEIKLLINLVKPKYFVPVHGEFKHLKKGAMLAESMGIAKENIVITDIGKVIEFKNGTVNQDNSVVAGRVLVDGLGVGDVGSVVLRDRKHLADDGIVMATLAISMHLGEMVSGPEIISRGFVYVKESEELIGEIRAKIKETVAKSKPSNSRDIAILRGAVRDEISDMIWKKTKRSPIVLAVILEV